VSIFLAQGDTGLMKDFTKKLVSGKRLRGGAPLCALPDFLDAVGEAGLRDSRLKRWKSRAIEKGLFNFNMVRPEK
jgi:hypothetical protein